MLSKRQATTHVPIPHDQGVRPLHVYIIAASVVCEAPSGSLFDTSDFSAAMMLFRLLIARERNMPHWAHCASRIDAVLQQFPIPEHTVFSYGTAGFRTTGCLLPAVGCRMSFVCALRSMVAGGRSTGLMITASHNPWEDNGVKLVDVDGCMLSRSWEDYATCIANATSSETLLAVTADFLIRLDVCPSSLGRQHARVHVARDTRLTGPTILEAFQAGCRALTLEEADSETAVDVVDHGITTTPQLHTMVYLDNRQQNPNHAQSMNEYFSRIADAFVSLSTPPSDTNRPCVVIDCGNGVGAVALRGLLQHHPEVERYVRIVLVNDRVDVPEALNNNCGADHAQKAKEVPASFFDELDNDPSALFFSFDGDADRVVAFHLERSTRTATLLDGDRIAILLTTLISSIFSGAHASAEAMQQLDIGIVQTAYANGASTAFVERTLKLRSYCAATGVKFLHPLAHERDIGVYFEANGHGTILFHENKIETLLSPTLPTVARQLALLSQLLSQVCGDALGDMLAVVVALQRLGWSSANWVSMYTDLPSIQLKVVVHSPKRIRCTPDERRAVAPEGLQEEIDAAVARCGDSSARSFVRPSGTEPLVRVYAEASTKDTVNALSSEVECIVRKFCS